MVLSPLIERKPEWWKTADWDTIHYMATISMGKQLAAKFRDPDLLTVIMAVPLAGGQHGYTFSAEVVPATSVFEPYPGDAVVLHIIGYNWDNEPVLLPETFREDITTRIEAMYRKLPG